MTMITARRHLLLASPALILAACASQEPAAPATGPATSAATPPVAPPAPAPAALPAANSRPDARVEITHWQLGMMGQVSWGDGVLIYRGRRLPFRVRGAGVGGVGMARVRASGDVFNLRDVSQFPGVYAQARTGIVTPGAQMGGILWLQNTSGVQLRLRPRRTGLAAQVGADGVLIEMR